MRLRRAAAVRSAAAFLPHLAATRLGRTFWPAAVAVGCVLTLGMASPSKASDPYPWAGPYTDKDPIVLTQHPGTGMGSSVDHRDARFQWHMQPELRYFCSLDGSSYELCSSGKTYDNLQPGRAHYFQMLGCEVSSRCAPQPNGCHWAMECTYVSYTWSIEAGATRRAYSAAPAATLPDLRIFSAVANGVAVQVSMLFGPLVLEPSDVAAPASTSAG